MKARFFKKEIKKLLKEGYLLYADYYYLVSQRKRYRFFLDFLMKIKKKTKRIIEDILIREDGGEWEEPLVEL